MFLPKINEKDDRNVNINKNQQANNPQVKVFINNLKL